MRKSIDDVVREFEVCLRQTQCAIRGFWDPTEIELECQELRAELATKRRKEIENEIVGLLGRSFE